MTKTLDYDEFHRTLSDTNAQARRRSYLEGLFILTGNGAWNVTERFDDRFDTQVGGASKIAKQWLDENGEVQSNLLLTMGGICSLPSVDRPPAIVDYKDNGRAYTLEEAITKGDEFAPVVARVRERMAMYQKIKPASQAQ